MKEQKTENKTGLTNDSNNAIFITRDGFGDCWEVFRTDFHGSCATMLFRFETEKQALIAGRKIAEAAGVPFYFQTDPRKSNTKERFVC